MSHGYAGPGGARREYIPGAHAACAAGGCQFTAAQEIVKTAEQIAAQVMERTRMSQALWCDQGGHAFSERDPGRKHISMDTLDDGGNTVKEARDFCGECAVQSGLTGARRTRPAQAIGFPTGSPSGSSPGAEPDDRDGQRYIPPAPLL